MMDLRKVFRVSTIALAGVAFGYVLKGFLDFNKEYGDVQHSDDENVDDSAWDFDDNSCHCHDEAWCFSCDGDCSLEERHGRANCIVDGHACSGDITCTRGERKCTGDMKCVEKLGVY